MPSATWSMASRTRVMWCPILRCRLWPFCCSRFSLGEKENGHEEDCLCCTVDGACRPSPLDRHKDLAPACNPRQRFISGGRNAGIRRSGGYAWSLSMDHSAAANFRGCCFSERSLRSLWDFRPSRNARRIVGKLQELHHLHGPGQFLSACCSHSSTGGDRERHRRNSDLIFGPPGTPGVSWGNFRNFTTYTAQVNSFLPAVVIPALAVIESVIEGILGLAMLLGACLRVTGWASSALLFLFGIAMTISLGVTSQFPFAVFVLAAGAWVLAILGPSFASIDALVAKLCYTCPRPHA